LNNAAKVYGLCVDNLHIEVINAKQQLGTGKRGARPAQGLHFTDCHYQRCQLICAEAGEDGDDEVAAAATRRREQARRQRANRALLETDPARINIQTGVDTTEYEADALFRRVCHSFDEGGLSGLLFNQVCASHIAFGSQ
jgi:hypothetical protein